ncbi:hypothetical protein ACLB1S_05380 [Escherichia coli]
MVTRFPALLYPLGNWICLLFMAAVLVIMLMTPGMAISVYLKSGMADRVRYRLSV